MPRIARAPEQSFGAFLPAHALRQNRTTVVAQLWEAGHRNDQHVFTVGVDPGLGELRRASGVSVVM
jgi:hypothetical protein